MKKMKTIIIILAVLLAGFLFLVLRGWINLRPAAHDGFGGDPEEFEHFVLSTSGTSADSEVYEATRTEDGVLLEYYISRYTWDSEKGQEAELRNVVRSVKGGEELYRQICALLGNCRIRTWDGFHGANPKGVLDGSSMSFSAELADGTKISAGGSNNFPSNYSTLRSTLNDLTTRVPVSDTYFTDGCFEVTLPESWVGKVTANFAPTYVSFILRKTDGSELTFFIIDRESYDYYPCSDKFADFVRIGTLEKDGEIRYISARNLYLLADYKSSLSEELLPLAESYEADRQAIISSLRGVGGYTLVPAESPAQP